jgi:hypothetical protein
VRVTGGAPFVRRLRQYGTRVIMCPDSRQLATATLCDFAGPGFDPAAGSLTEWLDALRAAGVRHAGPALILALEGLKRADCSPSRRFAVLRLLKTPVLKTCAGLPKPWVPGVARPGLATAEVRRGVTVEQRLYWLIFQNLNLALHQLDRCYVACDDRQARRRDWAARNLFRFFGRQLRYAALWGQPLPENTWRDLHDLYVYLMVRRAGSRAADGRVTCPGGAAGGHAVLDAENEYKQLLLFGLATQITASSVRDGSVLAGLSRWARQTVLVDPQGMSGDRGLYVVEVSADRPPHCHQGPLAADFRGWVLLPPTEFFDQLARSLRAEGRLAVPPPPVWQLAVAA